MMRHKEIEELIQKRLDKEITPDEEILLFNHIRECADCNTYYLEMEMVKDGIYGMIEFFPRADFNERILKHIRVKREKIWQRFVPAFLGIYLAGLAVLLFSPVLHYLLSKLLFATPGVIYLLDKAKVIGNGLILLIPSQFNIGLPYILTGFVLCVFVFYIFNRILKTDDGETQTIHLCV